MTNFMSDQHDEDIVAKVRHKLKSEVIMAYPGISASDDDDLMDTLLKAHKSPLCLFSRELAYEQESA
jgi:hypothetical protein